MFLSLLCSIAWGFDPGVGLGARGVRGSDGLHRLQPIGVVWVNQRVGEEGWFVKGEIITGGKGEQVLDGAIRQLVIGPGLLIGKEGGLSSTGIYGAVGPAAFLMLGGLDFDQWLARPGVRGEWGLNWALKSGLVVGGAFGGTFRGQGTDVDLHLSVGRAP